MIDPETEKVMSSLFNDEISFSSAVKKLKISDKQLQELIDNYHWIPSLDKIKQISELEKNSIALINEVIEKEELRGHHKKPKCCEATIRINPLSPRKTDYMIPKIFISPLTPVIKPVPLMDSFGSIVIGTHAKSIHEHANIFDNGFEYRMSGRLAQ